MMHRWKKGHTSKDTYLPLGGSSDVTNVWDRSTGLIIFAKQNRVLVVTFACLMFGIFFTALNVYELHRMQREHMEINHPITSHLKQPIYWLRAKKPDSPGLKHVRAVFERLGYVRGTQHADWTVLWSHDYPFKELKDMMVTRKPSQKVNHFPGSGYISNKAILAVTQLKHIPKAFNMPKEKDKFVEYVKENPDKMFVQKSNNHRGIKIKHVDDLDLDAEGSFIQEFVENPFLIDGHKFDIGIYTIITSINPIRVYIYDSDFLLRFCPGQYRPFDPSDTDKYVVKDDYLPTWKVPSLKYYYNDLKLNMKYSLQAYMESKGKDFNEAMNEMKAAIAEVVLTKETSIISSISNYPLKYGYFEMFRFDFVLDENMKVYLMEANMSPNLSSGHFPPNKLLYEQVLFNLLSLVGVATRTHGGPLHPTEEDNWLMQVSERDISVFPERCRSTECLGGCSHIECQLCYPCLSPEQITILKESFRENREKHGCQRIIPPPSDGAPYIKKDGLTAKNKWLFLWYEGMCQKDSTFC